MPNIIENITTVLSQDVAPRNNNIRLKELSGRRRNEENDYAPNLKPLEISQEEIRAFEFVLQNIGLPAGLTVETVSVRGHRFDNREVAQLSLILDFTLGVGATEYPVLSAHHTRLTPSTQIGKEFGVIIEVVQTDHNIAVEAKMTDPDISSQIAYTKFTDEQLASLANEKNKINQAVARFNVSVAPHLQADSLTPLLNLVGEVASRIMSR